MPTQAQLKANRKNARSSTGPRTPEGKARSSANSVSHGLAGARFYLLPGEDPQAFETLHQAFRAEHLPSTITEDALVLDLARAHWKLARISRLQSELDPSSDDFLDRFLRLERYETSTRRAFHLALDQLRKLRAERRREANPISAKPLIGNSLRTDLRAAMLREAAQLAVNDPRYRLPSADSPRREAS